jgi:hypothetical protein
MVNRAPTTSDYAGYNIGHIWVYDTDPQVIYMLTNKDNQVATWILLAIGGAGDVTQVLGGDNINVDNGGGPIVTVNLDESIFQPVTSADGLQGLYALGGNDFLHAYGTQNTFLGESAGNRTLTVLDATENTGVGFQVLSHLTTGELNTAVGDSALGNVTTGERNTAIGHDSTDSLVTGDGNTALGSDTLSQLSDGDYNLALGMRAGFNYTGVEGSNILLSNEGTLGESNVIRIGTQGAGSRQQDTTYIAGIYQSAFGAANEVVFVDSAGKIGSSKGNDGEILIGATAGPPIWTAIVSGDGSITIAQAANSIDIRSVGAGGGSTTFITDVNSPAVVAGGNITFAGAGVLESDGGSGSNTVTYTITDGTNGQLLIGGGGVTPVWGNLASAGGSVNITYPGANQINLETVGGGGGATTFVTDAGNANTAAGNINVLGGDNINTAGAGSTVTVHLDQSILQPNTNAAGTQGLYSLGGIDFLHNYGTYNTFCGEESGSRTLTVLNATDNTGFGSYTLDSLTTGSSNSFLGSDAGRDVTTGDNNSGAGYQALANVTTGGNNSAIGCSSFNGITTGSSNIGLGCNSGTNCTVNDSSNILIGNSGSAGLDNTIIIGTQGAGAGQQNRCFIAGVYNVNVGATNEVMFVDNTGQVGTSAGNNGELLIGSTGATPTWANLASADGSVTIVNGAGTIDLSVPAGDVTTVNGGTNITTVNPGGPVVTVNLDDDVSLAGFIDVGTYASVGTTLTVGTGITLNNNDIDVLAGGVNALTFDTSVAAAGVTLSGTTLQADGTDVNIDINITPKGTGLLITTDILADNYYTNDAATGLTGTGTAVISSLGRGVVQSSAGGELSSSEGTDGQVLISSSSGAPAWATLTEGTNITITEGANSITINGSGVLSINEQVGTTYTLVLTDAGKEIRFTNGSAVSLTIPPNSSVAFPIGTEIIIVQYGAGTVTVGPGSGVTINSAGGRLDLYEQYSAAALIKQNVDEWLLAGDIS